MDFLNFDIFSYIVLPFLIFLARICDVTIGTIRIILVAKGRSVLAPVLGFFEVLIWIFVISRIMQNLNNVTCYIAYAAGFATGNYIGMKVEEKLALGLMMIRVVTAQDASPLVNDLQKSDFGVTCVNASGSHGDVHVVYTVVLRNDIEDVVNMIHKFNPDAFYSIEDIRYVNKGVFPPKKAFIYKSIINFKFWRKGK